MRTILLGSLFFVGALTWAQGEGLPPDVRSKCDSILVAELGQKIFDSCVTLTSHCKEARLVADRKHPDGGTFRQEFRLDYTFTFPDVERGNFKIGFQGTQVYGKLTIQSSAFLRKDRSDLPEGFAENGLEIVDYQQAKDSACADMPLPDSKCDRLEGSLVLSQDAIHWVFSAHFPVQVSTNGRPDERYVRQVVRVDPYSGRVVSSAEVSE